MGDLATDTVDLAADVRAWLQEHPAAPPGDDDAFARAFEARITDVIGRLEEVGVPGTTSTGVSPVPDRVRFYVAGDLRDRLADHLMIMAAELGRRGIEG